MGHNVPKRLWQYHGVHGLNVCHAYSLGSLSLSRIYGEYAAAHGFRHIRARVDGNYEQRRLHRAEVYIKELGKAVIYKHGLYHHGGAAEYLHIGVQQEADELHKYILYGMRLVGRRGLHYAHPKAYQAAHSRRYHGYEHRGARAP